MNDETNIELLVPSPLRSPPQTDSTTYILPHLLLLILELHERLLDRGVEFANEFEARSRLTLRIKLDLIPCGLCRSGGSE